MVISEIRLLDFLIERLRLPETEARTHVRTFVAAEEKLHAEITETIDKKFEERKDTLATKEDIHSLDEKITVLQLATKEDIYAVRQEIKALEVRMEQNTNKLLIWLVSVIFAASGLIVALIKFL